MYCTPSCMTNKQTSGKSSYSFIRVGQTHKKGNIQKGALTSDTHTYMLLSKNNIVMTAAR